MENCSVSQRKSLSCRYAVHWCALNIREVYKSGISKDQCFCICFNFLVCACGCLSLECHVRFVKDQMTKCAVKHMSNICWIQDAFWMLYGNQKAGWPSHNVQAKKVQVLTPHRSCVFARLKKHLVFFAQFLLLRRSIAATPWCYGPFRACIAWITAGLILISPSATKRRGRSAVVLGPLGRGVKVEQFGNRLH